MMAMDALRIAHWNQVINVRVEMHTQLTLVMKSAEME